MSQQPHEQYGQPPVSSPGYGHPVSGPGAGVPSQGYAVPYSGPYSGPPQMHPGPAGYPPALAPNGQPLAEFGDRFIARLIDTAIYIGMALVFAIPLIVVIVWSVSTVEPGDEPGGAQLATLLLAELGYVVLSYVGQYLYEVEYQLRRDGQSVGKKVMKLRIIRTQPGQMLTRGVLAKRWVVWGLVAACVPFFQLIDGLWQLWDKPYKQTLHDKFADTVVVKEPA